MAGPADDPNDCRAQGSKSVAAWVLLSCTSHTAKISQAGTRSTYLSLKLNTRVRVAVEREKGLYSIVLYSYSRILRWPWR